MRERNLKKGGKIRRQSTINIIPQKERNKINLNLLNYLKKVFICTVIMVKMMNNFFLIVMLFVSWHTLCYIKLLLVPK